MIQLDITKKLTSPSGDMQLRVQTNITLKSFLVVYGKSGAGKTSLLRILAGLMRPEQGQIKVNDRIWLDTRQKLNLPPRQRGIGFMFQEAALFPNMTVQENLRFALGKKQDEKIIKELIDILDLGQLRHQKPGILSGGQKQRTALARALVPGPSLLLLDEPLSAQDPETRKKLQAYILRVHKAYRLSIIMVSHDLTEISRMADEVMVLEQGRIVRQDTPEAIFIRKDLNGNPCACPFVFA